MHILKNKFAIIAVWKLKKNIDEYSIAVGQV